MRLIITLPNTSVLHITAERNAQEYPSISIKHSVALSLHRSPWYQLFDTSYIRFRLRQWLRQRYTVKRAVATYPAIRIGVRDQLFASRIHK